MKTIKLLMAIMVFAAFSCSDDSPKLASLSFDNASEEMLLEQTKTFAYKWGPDDVEKPVVNWTSSDSDVATVNAQGEVKALTVGTTTIKVDAVNNPAITASFTLTVKPIAVSGITFATAKSEVIIGEDITLTPTVKPDNATDKTLAWTSSDEAIAVVDDGVVTGVTVGTVTITASKDGVSATHEVEVKPIEVTAVNIDPEPQAIMIGQTKQLVFSVLPDNATDKTLTWASNNEALVSVDENGVITIKGIGAAEITATAVNGVSATISVSGMPVPPPPPPPPAFN
ncbi:Ig domain-containing protein [Puteibacter caeruleilacunae]|nr:Ig domain-containing protein [Puteibacter caeruleilacunae]